MGQTPYGYRFENGTAIVDAKAAERLRALCANYLSGMSLKSAAAEAGLDIPHASAKNLLTAKRYLGDGFYPAIIDRETYDRVQAEKTRRAAALGRLDRKPKQRTVRLPTRFTLGEITEHYDNPAAQAEYIYSLITSEVV